MKVFCHNNIKSLIEAKLISFQVSLVLQSMLLGVKKGLLKLFMRHFYLKMLNFTCNIFLQHYLKNFNVDMRTCE